MIKKWRTTKTIVMLIVFSFLGLCAIPQSRASVPGILAYQGILKDSSGNYLTGTYSMTFKLYSAASGGTALWTETQSSVSTSSGKFSVQLGSVSAINLSFSQDYWLGITVGADSEMTPRVKLSSVGYAFTAQNVVNGFTQSQHDALDHKNIEGVKDNSVLIGKTNFKLDSYSSAAANSMGDMVVDAFNDASGINAGASSGYTWRGSSNYDVVATPGGIDSNAVLMLHSNGTNGSTTFTDSENTAKTVTANGSAQITTAQSKFGGASGSFNGTNSYLSVPDSADWNYGSGDFTVDFWVRFNATGAHNFFEQRPDANNMLIFDYGGTSFRLFHTHSAGTQDFNLSWSWTIDTGVWHHIALVRNGSNFKVYVDGASLGTQSASGTIQDFAASLTIGFGAHNGRYLNGWLDEFRISKGIARWTSNFTVPSAEYSTSSGTATVISNAYSEAAAPTSALVMADETLNTGSITYYVSRDNGTTWTTCTKETVTSISSQPTGTQVKWKAVITGDAELNAIALAV